MAWIFVVAAYAIYLFTDILPAVRTKKPAYVWPCVLLFALGFAVQILYEMHISVPSPNEPISNFFTGLFNLQ